MINTIKCTKCKYESEWEEMFYGDNADMIVWDDGAVFKYKCEKCGHEFKVVTTIVADYDFESHEMYFHKTKELEEE